MKIEQDIRHQINVAQIADTAKNLVKHIDGFNSIRKINPDNLVILLGEFHGQVPQHYFEKKFLQYLRRDQAIGSLCIEGNVRFQDEVDRAANLSDAARFWQAVSNKNGFYRLVDNHPIHYAIRNKMPVYCVDAPDEWDVDEFDRDTLYVGDVLGDGFQDKYGKSKMLRYLMRKNAKELFSKTYEHANDSDIGMMKRNLFMMDKIMDASAQHNGVSVAIVGHKHIVNPDFPLQPTLSEMLFANGKDVINLSLYPAHNIHVMQYRYNYNAYMKKLARSNKLQRSRLIEQGGWQKNAGNYVDMRVEFSGQMADNWLGMAGSYVRNGEIPPLFMPVLHVATKIADLRP